MPFGTNQKVRKQPLSVSYHSQMIRLYQLLKFCSAHNPSDGNDLLVHTMIGKECVLIRETTRFAARGQGIRQKSRKRISKTNRGNIKLEYLELNPNILNIVGQPKNFANRLFGGRGSHGKDTGRMRQAALQSLFETLRGCDNKPVSDPRKSQIPISRRLRTGYSGQYKSGGTNIKYINELNWVLVPVVGTSSINAQ